jgi:hypothetical protein
MIPVMVKQSPPVHRRVMVTPADLLQRRKQIKHLHSPGHQIRQHPPLQLVLRGVFRFRRPRPPNRKVVEKHVFIGDLGRIEEINVEERLREALKTPDEGHTLEDD